MKRGEKEHTDTKKTPQQKPGEVLRQLVDLFHTKGWLNRHVRIVHNERKYRVFCSESQFSAYRVNDHWGMPPGVPGWFVCLVTEDRILEDLDANDVKIKDRAPSYWLQCIKDNDYQLI
jgi:hypothetical protein